MNKRVVFIDDNESLRELFQELMLLKLGEACLCLNSFDEVRERVDEVLNSRVSIIDINLGFNQPSGIDIYDWLLKSGYKGTICFLTGHGSSHPAVEKARQQGSIVWEKPMGINLIIDAIKMELE